MNRYKIIYDQFLQANKQTEELELEYSQPGKIKGDAYSKRKHQLVIKKDDLLRKAKEIGTVGNICHVYGKMRRIHKSNPKLTVVERFNLYFINISEEEASALVKLHIKNLVQYQIRFIRPGIIFTS